MDLANAERAIIYNMKKWIKLFIIFAWLINVDAGEKTEWWVELINDNGTITKVKRCDYLEYKELIDFPVQNIDNDRFYYYLWEKDYQKDFMKPYKHDIKYGCLYTIQVEHFIKYLSINEN